MNTTRMKRLTTAERERRDKLIVAHYLRRHSQRATGAAFCVSRMTVCRVIARYARDLERSASVKNT